MPRIRRQTLPPALLNHLLDRFKRFPEMIVCGEGELVKTFLRPGQVPAGDEVI